MSAGTAGRSTLKVEPLKAPFEALGRAVLRQQVTGAAADAIQGRLQALFDASRFPLPEEVDAAPDALLRSAGVSGGKVRALRDLARHQLEGKLPSALQMKAMDDAAIVAALTAVHGIGPWTVHMLLMFRLGRMDVLPVGDYGVRKGFQKTFRSRALPDARTLTARAERWRPFRSAAAWYLWRALEEG